MLATPEDIILAAHRHERHAQLELGLDDADGGGDVEGVEQARDVLPHEALAERPHSG